MYGKSTVIEDLVSREINVSKIIAEGDGRTRVGASLYLTVRGGSARWEYQHRVPGAKSLKSEWLAPQSAGPVTTRYDIDRCPEGSGRDLWPVRVCGETACA